jgi:hypothetical protein
VALAGVIPKQSIQEVFMSSYANKASQTLALTLSVAVTFVCANAARADASKEASSPNYQDTVAYITDKFQQAGIPGNTQHGKGATYVQDDMVYSFSVESCDSMTITMRTGLHVDDPNDTPSHSDSSSTIVTRIPFSSIAVQTMLNGGRSASVPVTFSTHTITQNPNNGADLADGYPIGRWDMRSFSIGGSEGEWHDTVYVVAKDSGVTWKSTGSETGPASGQMKPNVPLPIVPFWLPGTGATSSHVAKAIQHLADICINHASQSPKEMF